MENREWGFRRKGKHGQGEVEENVLTLEESIGFKVHFRFTRCGVAADFEEDPLTVVIMHFLSGHLSPIGTEDMKR